MREQLENNAAGEPDMNSEEMDEGEKALLREMCNVSSISIKNYLDSTSYHANLLSFLGRMEKIRRSVVGKSKIEIFSRTILFFRTHFSNKCITRSTINNLTIKMLPGDAAPSTHLTMIHRGIF